MSLFSTVYEELQKNKQIRLAGGYTCIPWKNLPRFSKVLPGVQKKRYYICTANSKVGKTQLADYLFLYEPFDFVQKNETNIDVKIFYFSLELSKEEKTKQAIARKLFRETKKIVSPEHLDSTFEEILDDHTEELIGTFDEYFKTFEEKITFVDTVRNPFGIYQYMREYAEKNGYYVDKQGRRMSVEDARKHSLEIDRYIPNNPDEYVIVITDHISLLTPERGETLHSAISKFSSSYCLSMRDRFGYTVVNVQQQAADQEKQQFTLVGGRTIVDKLRPSPDGLGDNKLTGRDCDVMLGLFAPHRYKIDEYPEVDGYNIRLLRDRYRELSILLNRRGSGFINTHMYFHGAINYFAELPSAGEIDYTKL